MARLLPLLVVVVVHIIVVPTGLAEVSDDPDSYVVSYAPAAVAANGPQEYLDPTFPAPRPPLAAPSCIVPLLSHSFDNTYGHAPAKAAYAPPGACPEPWALVVLTFSAASAGKQYARVAAVWLDGVELLRTTTAEPTSTGVTWVVRKDVTRFSALLHRPPDGVLSVILENVINEKYNGVYHVNVSLEFHGATAFVDDVAHSDQRPTLPESYFQPANRVLPISDSACQRGYWFRIQNESDSSSKSVTIPSNTYRAVLEVFVSHHADDEFWYSNPPDLYIKENNISTRRGNGAFREVVVSVDSFIAGSFVPFPVIYSSGINPLFWQPVVALGAFNLPSYDVELTPFLGLLLDGKPHDIAISVVDGIQEWLVDANLHLWLDPNSSTVSGGLGKYKTPRLKLSRRYSTQLLDGKYKIHGKRKSFFTGWVNSSFGNFTTEVETKLKVSSLVEFRDQGNNKTVELEAEQKIELTVRSEKRKVIGKEKSKTRYPLRLNIFTKAGGNDTEFTTLTANLSHALHHETERDVRSNDDSKVRLDDEQLAEGWMVNTIDHDVVNGSVTANSTYRYSNDDRMLERMISVQGGSIISDNITESYAVLSSPDDCVGAAGGNCSVNVAVI